MPLRAEVIDQLRRHFEQARTYPAPSRCDDLDERFYEARDAFSAPRFKALYRMWKRDGDVALAEVGSHAIHKQALRSRDDYWRMSTPNGSERTGRSTPAKLA
jgi:hypothetical protein